MKKIGFYLASDTLVHLMAPVLSAIFDKAEVRIIFPLVKKEGAFEAYERLYPGKLHLVCSANRAFELGLDYLVCGNDWGAEIKLLIWYARRRGVTTIAIQESVVDLSSKSDRYLYADLIFVQGLVSKRALRRDDSLVLGNPRYEHLRMGRHGNDFALVNCNFTYGVFEEVREEWISEVVQALKSELMQYRISKHPRDLSNLHAYREYILPSNAGVVHDQIRSSRLLVTRFSSLIHEAIAMGCPVIYYNPHGEDMGYPFEPDGKVLHFARSYEELVGAVKYLSGNDLSQQDFENYLVPHLYGQFSDERASERIASMLNSDKSLIQVPRNNNLYEIRLRPVIWTLVKEYLYSRVTNALN